MGWELGQVCELYLMEFMERKEKCERERVEMLRLLDCGKGKNRKDEDEELMLLDDSTTTTSSSTTATTSIITLDFALRLALLVVESWRWWRKSVDGGGG